MIAAMYRATIWAVSPICGWRYSVTGVSTLTSASKWSTERSLAVVARHRRIDLGNHMPRHGEHRRRQVDGHTEADEAASIGRQTWSKATSIGSRPAASNFGTLLEADRHVIELPGQVTYVAANKNVRSAICVVEVPPPSGSADVRHEADELEIGRARLIAERGEQVPRGAAQPVPKIPVPGLIALGPAQRSTASSRLPRLPN